MLELITARLIEENDSVLIVVYAVNQKGKSAGVVIRDLELGTTVRVDRGESRVAAGKECRQFTCFCLLLFISNTRKPNCVERTRLHAIFHRHRDNHPHRVHTNCIQNDVHLLGGEVV